MVRCKSCGKTVRTIQSFQWSISQKCSECYCRDNNFKKVKINREGKSFELVYVNEATYMQILSRSR